MLATKAGAELTQARKSADPQCFGRQKSFQGASRQATREPAGAQPSGSLAFQLFSLVEWMGFDLTSKLCKLLAGDQFGQPRVSSRRMFLSGFT